MREEDLVKIKPEDNLKKIENESDFIDEFINKTIETGFFYEKYLESLFERYGKNKVIDFIQDRIVSLIDDNKIEVDIDLFLFLGQINKISERCLLLPSLAKKLEEKGSEIRYKNILLVPILELIEKDDQDSRLKTHRLINFLKVYLKTVKNEVRSAEELEMFLFRSSGIISIRDMFEIDLLPSLKVKNYLIIRNIEDLIGYKSSFDFDESELSGVPAERQDEMLFIHRNTANSYRNRLKMGLFEGYPAADFVCEVAPNYFGKYSNGELKEVYEENNRYDVEVIEREMIKRNNPDDDWIYGQINFQTNVAKNQSQKLNAFQDIWDFREELKEENRTFYFDISKLNSNTHPFVLSSLLTYNQELIHLEYGNYDESKPVENNFFTEKLLGISNDVSKTFERYQVLSSLHMRKKVIDDFGIDISNLSFIAQKHFLNFLENLNIERIDPLKLFIEKYSYVGLSTFLSLEQSTEGEDFGDEIVFLGNYLSEEDAKLVFEKYSSIVEIANNLEQYLIEKIPEGRLDEETLEKIRENLLKKAKDILVHFIDRTKKAKEGNTTLLSDELKDSLDKIKEETILSVSILRTLHEDGKIAIEELADFSQQEIDPKEIEEDDPRAQRMIELYKQSYSQKPKLQEILVENFRKIFGSRYAEEGKEIKIHTVFFNDEIVGFFALVSDSKRPGVLEFKAFNVDENFRGSYIGEEMMQTILDKVAEAKIIFAECNGDLPVSSNYIERGFAATSVELVFEDPHKITIYRNEKENALIFRTKRKEMTLERIIKESEEQASDIKVFVREKNGVHDYKTLNDQEEKSEYRWVLTRSVLEKQSGKTYLVYEKVKLVSLSRYCGLEV